MRRHDARGTAAGRHAQSLPPIRHVFVIVLENQSYEATFGRPSSAAPYLAHELPPRGALLTQYYGIGHYSLDNYLALISGQAPNEDTRSTARCFMEFRPTRRAGCERAAARRRLRLPGARADARPTSSKPPGSPGRPTWRIWATTRRASARPARTCRSATRITEQRAERRSVRHQAQPVRLLPLDHR